MRVAALICFAVVAGATCISTYADEIVIDQARQTAGDFSCSPFSNQMSPQLDLKSGAVSAGALWKFYNSQGSRSIHNLTLCLDLESMEDDASFGLEAVELKIEHPDQNGELLTNVSLGNNFITVLGYDTSSYKPEAKLELALDYDFMKRFSADSNEMISVKFQTNDQAVVPKFSVQSEADGFFSGFKNPLLLVGFSLFWVAFFHLLSRLTKPVAAAIDGTKAAAVN